MLKAFLVTLCLLSCLSAPAQAAIQRSADFEQGSSFGIGVLGMSYDYGLGPFSLGAMMALQNQTRLISGNVDGLRFGTRALWRITQWDNGLSLGLLGGLTFDPRDIYSRANQITPDLGFSVAYDFRKVLQLPLALRLNLTVGLAPNTEDYSSGQVYSHSSLFQRLQIGPNTSFEFAWMPLDMLEVTLGGGTWLGLRMKF